MSKKDTRYNDYDYDDEDDFPRKQKKKESHRRREPRNWKKAWDNVSQAEYFDDPDFYRTKR